MALHWVGVAGKKRKKEKFRGLFFWGFFSLLTICHLRRHEGLHDPKRPSGRRSPRTSTTVAAAAAGDVDAQRHVLDRGAGVEQAGVDAGPSRVVGVADGVPQRGGVGLAHAHDLLGVSVAHKVGLLDAVEERIAHVPVVPFLDRQAPGERRLVEVDEQAERQGAQRDPLVVEARRDRGGRREEGADPGEEQR